MKDNSPSNPMGTHDLIALLPETIKRTIKEEALLAQRILSSLGEPTPSLRILEGTVFDSFNEVSTHVSPDHEDFNRYHWVYMARQHEAYVRLFGGCVATLIGWLEQSGLLPNLPLVFEVVTLALDDLEDLRGKTPQQVNPFEDVVVPLVMKRAAKAFPHLFSDGD